LQYAVEDFKSRLDKFDDGQGEYETHIEEEDDLLKEITETGEFRDSKCVVLLEAKKVLSNWKSKAAKTNDSKSGIHATGTSTGPAGLNTRLPILELPMFNGNILEWCHFWDQFIAVVDKSDLPTITKYTYLHSLLTGEAK
jgi:hypothetical protein